MRVGTASGISTLGRISNSVIRFHGRRRPWPVRLADAGEGVGEDRRDAEDREGDSQLRIPTPITAASARSAPARGSLDRRCRPRPRAAAGPADGRSQRPIGIATSIATPSASRLTSTGSSPVRVLEMPPTLFAAGHVRGLRLEDEFDRAADRAGRDHAFAVRVHGVAIRWTRYSAASKTTPSGSRCRRRG